jgi:DNA replication protein DnaC
MAQTKEKLMIEELLKELKMLGALSCFRDLKEDTVDLEVLLKSEIEWREIKQGETRLSSAKFPLKKDWAEIDYQINPEVPFAQIKSYTSNQFIEEKKNLCFIGTPGLGKTHCLVAIGRALCRKGYSVKFFTAIDLVTLLIEAQREHQFSKVTKQILRPDLLIIDELGYVPFSDEGARVLFDVFSKRYERGSIAVSTNLAMPKWGEIFGSKELTTALLDRFNHHCKVYYFKGTSYRVLHNRRERTIN